MPPKTAPRPRPTPDVLPDSLPRKEQRDVLPDDLRRGDRPDTPPDSLPKVDKTEEAEIAEAEEQSWQEHPEGSAPPLDRLTQDRKPETDEG